MLFQICVGSARVIALSASKRLFATVNQHVGFQHLRLSARVAAFVAAVGLLAIIQGMLC